MVRSKKKKRKEKGFWLELDWNTAVLETIEFFLMVEDLALLEKEWWLLSQHFFHLRFINDQLSLVLTEVILYFRAMLFFR